MSIRLKPELLAEVEAYAKANGLKIHAAVVALIDLGLAPRIAVKRLPAASRTTWPSGALIEAHHTEDPTPKLTLGSAVTFGPRKFKAGDLAKKPKGK